LLVLIENLPPTFRSSPEDLLPTPHFLSVHFKNLYPTLSGPLLQTFSDMIR
jgi:hypothetical protein